MGGAPATLEALLYDAVRRRLTGIGRLKAADLRTAPLTLELSAGWVYAVQLSPAYSLVGPAPQGGEERLHLLLKLTEPYFPRIDWVEREQPTRSGACVPFHPGAVLRRHVEATRSAQGLDGGWRRLAATSRLQLTALPPSQMLLEGERPLLARLLQPHGKESLEELCRSEGEPVERLLAFLARVSAFEVTPASRSPLAVLGLDGTASVDEIRRAYHRLAREVHPDRWRASAASEQARARARFEELTEAYRLLVGREPDSHHRP
jgi:hypothetical protein